MLRVINFLHVNEKMLVAQLKIKYVMRYSIFMECEILQKRSEQYLATPIVLFARSIPLITPGRLMKTTAVVFISLPGVINDTYLQ